VTMNELQFDDSVSIGTTAPKTTQPSKPLTKRMMKIAANPTFAWLDSFRVEQQQLADERAANRRDRLEKALARKREVMAELEKQALAAGVSP